MQPGNREVPAAAPSAKEVFRLAFLNLDDAFLNASIQHSLMLRTPPEQVPVELWTATDRARLERTWIAFLYVLIEAWDSNFNSAMKLALMALPGVSADVLTNELKYLRKSGLQDRMKDLRDYMFHRDRRDLWDEARGFPIGKLARLTRLHHLFGEIIRSGRRTLRPATQPGE